jgi:hypothetical protein
MNTTEFAKKIYHLCIENVNKYWTNFFKSKNQSECDRIAKEYQDFRDIYVALSVKQQVIVDRMIKKVSIDTLSTFCSILDNRDVGDFDEDFTLLYGKDNEKLNDFELLDELQNYASVIKNRNEDSLH